MTAIDNSESTLMARFPADGADVANDEYPELISQAPRRYEGMLATDCPAASHMATPPITKLPAKSVAASRRRPRRSAAQTQGTETSATSSSRSEEHTSELQS